MKITRKTLVKAYVAYSLCMDSDVFIRIFGGISDGGAQIGGFQSANPVLLMFSVVLVSSSLLLVLPIFKRVATVMVNVPLLTGLYLWALASCLWAEKPAMVIRLWVPLCAYLLCGAIAAYYLSAGEVAALIGDLTTVIAVLSILWERFDPVRGTIAPGWTGVYGEKNHLGMGMGVGIIALLVVPGRWTAGRCAKLLVCTVLLVGSQSMTAVVFVMAATLTFALVQLPARAKPLGLSVVLTGLVAPLALVPGVVGKLFASAGKETNFTGRDVIWAFVYGEWLRRPVLGYGYGNYWVTQADRVEGNLGWNPGSAHNGSLETMLNLGAVGLVLLLGALASGLYLCWRAWRQGQRTAAVWLLLAWLAMFIDDLTEADFMVPAPLWFTFCLVLFLTYASLHRREPAKASSPEHRHEAAAHLLPQAAGAHAA